MVHSSRRPPKRRLRIVKNGNPALRKISEPITVIDDGIRKLASQMTVSMLENDIVGVGLAAPQVGINKRMIVIDTSCDEVPANELSPGEVLLNPQMPLALINPVIVSASEDTITRGEGCLSLPGVDGDVTRPAEVLLKATLLDGQEIQCQCAHLLARCLQHEIDHLDGVLFIDHCSEEQQKKADAVMKQLAKAEKKYIPSNTRS
ncbi:MAG: peptide deformylase [Victivallales bacterium]|nr:peptide deformylase [Victivallales bacterium]